jgi:hypothetical protein
LKKRVITVLAILKISVAVLAIQKISVAVLAIQRNSVAVLAIQKISVAVIATIVCATRAEISPAAAKPRSPIIRSRSASSSWSSSALGGPGEPPFIPACDACV